jgi:hypothetical protein
MGQAIGTGMSAIRVSEILTPGQLYKLPLWPIINTGDEYGCFDVKTDPRTDLLDFDPVTFCLEQGKVKQVEVTLTLPLNEPKGKREFVLEAKKTLDPFEIKDTGSQVGAAVGTKLFFEVGPSPGILGALSQRANSIWTLHLGLATAISVALCLVIAFFFSHRAFDFKIRLRK